MTQDQIIEFAQQATSYTNNQTDAEGYNWDLIRDEYFANLVAKYEREQCAQLVEPTADHLQNPWHYLGGDEGVELLLELAQAIRSRGEP